MRIALATAALAVVGATGVMIGNRTADPEPTTPTVACPAEDSCEIDFRDGAWHIRTYDDNSETPSGPWVRVSR